MPLRGNCSGRSNISSFCAFFLCRAASDPTGSALADVFRCSCSRRGIVHPTGKIVLFHRADSDSPRAMRGRRRASRCSMFLLPSPELSQGAPFSTPNLEHSLDKGPRFIPCRIRPWRPPRDARITAAISAGKGKGDAMHRLVAATTLRSRS